jgi:hypothetical protein
MQRATDGSIVLCSWHPSASQTWHWAIYLKRNATLLSAGKLWHRAKRRSGQWHDYYRLPLSWCLIVARQDFHKEPKP